jgi:hypothetical protein
MRGPSRATVVVASLALALGSCVSAPAAQAPAAPLPATQAPAAQAPTAALPSGPVPAAKPADIVWDESSAPLDSSAAPASAAASSSSSSDSSRPEISFPYHRAIKPFFIIASLHEPELPLAAAPKPAAIVTPAPTAAAAPAAIVAPAQEAQPIAAATPKATAASPKAATVSPKAASATKAPATAQKPKETAVANAPSSLALSVVADPVPQTKADIGRNYTVVEGKRFEVPFDGTGWTYLGEKTLREGISYDSRRYQGSSLVFILNPIKAGDYILRFQRQDALRGLSYEELIGVTVTPKPAATVASSPVAAATTASAAASPATVSTTSASAAVNPANATATGASVVAKPSSATTAPSSANAVTTTASAPAGLLVNAASLTTPEAALAAARSELAADRPQGALEALDRLIALAPAGTDEAYVLYARALEKNGPQKDIKRAYAYYKKLRDEYPESAFWDEADARASYIERHYFEIR